jgi:hypothetical protein
VENTDIKEVVKEKYGQAALRVKTGGSSCCGAGPSSESGCDPITANLYDASQMQQIPEEAVLASLGCGNPTALAAFYGESDELNLEAETIKDLDPREDSRAVQGGVLMLATVFVLANLAVDLVYALADPRVRLDGEGA